jgi:hypothetical protein
VHFLLTTLLQFYPCYYGLNTIYFSCTCFVPTKSVLILVTSPAPQNLLLRRWRWCGILWRGVLGLRCPSCIFLWIMEPSAIFLLWELFSILKDNICVIIIHYLWHLTLLWTLIFVCVEIFFLGTHAMNIRFWSKNQVWYARSMVRFADSLAQIC